MPDTGDIGYKTCSICGVMYNRFVVNECPVCKLRKGFTNNDENCREDSEIVTIGDGWNDDI